MIDVAVMLCIFMAITLVSPFNFSFANANTVPAAPALVQVVPFNQSSLQVDITPPLTDGGQEVTAYEIQWDTEPGIREIQTISTQVTTGPNEIQSITITATHIDEVQTITTSSNDVNEVQTITVSSTLSTDIGGSYTIVFDDSSTGGSAQESASISHAAVAYTGENGAAAEQSLEEILENMQNIGDVAVTRVITPHNPGTGGNDYSIVYNITFLENERDLPEIRLGTSQLTGAGVDVNFNTITDGNMLGGSFMLSFEGQQSSPITHDATDAEMQLVLQALPNIDTVEVLRSGPDAQLGYTWTVTFTSDAEPGSLPLLVQHTGSLSGTGSNVTVSEMQDGNQIDGSVALTFDSNTVNISYDATASEIETALESTLNTGNVDVTRSGPDRNRGYSWTISFLQMEGDIGMIATNDGALTGIGATSSVVELHKGTFKEIHTIVMDPPANVTVTFDGVSAALPFDGALGCSAPVKERMESLSTVGTVTVACTSFGSGYAYGITYDTNAGDLTNKLTATGSSVVYNRTGTSTVIGGKFTVEYAGQRTGYLPYTTTAAAMKTALEQLSTIGTVDVTRSDETENRGYVWSVTFQTEMGNIASMVTDSKALTGTDAKAVVTQVRKGVAPPFNSTLGGTHPLNYDRMTDLSSLRYYIVYHQRDDYIEQLRQGVPYYVRVSAINSVGEGAYAVSTPRSTLPISLPPTQPTDVNLVVIDGYSLNVTWHPPIHDGGKSIDKYKIEWDNADIIAEVQSVTITSPVTKEVQIVNTNATTIYEEQVIYTSSVGTGNFVNEIQTIKCNANGGSIKLTFNGKQTDAISWDATDDEIATALQSLSTIATVTVTIANSQTTLCASSAPALVSVNFTAVPGYAGDVPLMTVNVDALQGNKAVSIVEATPGEADIGGSFSVSFRGLSETINYNESQATMANKLSGIIGQTVAVTRSSALHGKYAWTITFNHDDLGGNIEDILVSNSGLTGNGAGVDICVDGSSAGTCSSHTSVKGNEIGGTFTLSLLGHTSAPIPYNAEQTTMKSALESMDIIGTVDVVRSGPTPQRGYDWTITFTSMPGSFPIGSENVDTVGVDSTMLTGSGVGLYAVEETAGSDPLTGTFKLSFDSTSGNQHQTADIKKDASSTGMKNALELLPNVGHVTVTRQINLDGYTWKVTFASCRTDTNNLADVCNVGDLRMLTADYAQIHSGTVSVSQIVQGSGNSGNVTLHPSQYYNSVEVTDLASGAPYNYQINNLVAGITYYVRVSAHNQCPDTCPGCCGYGVPQVSSPRFAVPANQIPGAVRAPRLVSSSRTTSSTSDVAAITISWDKPTINGGSIVTGYEVWMDDWMGGGFARIYDGTNLPNIFTFDTSTSQMNDLEPGRQYRFKVRALNDVGTGPFGKFSTFTARMPIAPIATSFAAPKRDEMTNPGSSITGDAEIWLRWEPPVDNGGDPITKYEVHRDDGMGGSFSNHVCTAGQTEVQSLVATTSSSGTFTLGYKGATSDNINHDATSDDVKSAIEGLMLNGEAIFYPAVEVSRNAVVNTVTWSITFFGTNGDIGNLIVDKGNMPSGAVVQVTETTGGCGSPEVQRITTNDKINPFSLVVGGSIISSISANVLTSTLKSGIENALNSLHGGGHQFIVNVVASSNNSSYIYDVIFESGYYAENANPEINRIDFPGSFRLMRSEGAVVTRAQTGTLLHRVGGLSEGLAYRFKIRAFNDFGGSGVDSPITSILAAAVPPASAQPTIVDVTANDISISWVMPTEKGGSPFTGFRIYQFEGVAPNTVIEPEPVKLEIQRIYTEADTPRQEQQTLSFKGATVGSGLTFTLRYKGEETVDIAYTASTLKDDIKSAIQGLSSFYGGIIDTISGDSEDVTIAFNAAMGDVSDITISPSVAWPVSSTTLVTEVVKGRAAVSGDFTVFYKNEETRRLSYDETASGMMQALENLDGIGELSVTRNSLGNGSFEWIVTFLTEMGNLPSMTTTSGRLLASRPFARVNEVQAGTESTLVYNGDKNPNIKEFVSTGLLTDTTYAYKVVTMNAVGHSRNGIASQATTTVIARAGASASHTSLAGSSLIQGVAGIVYEEQIVSVQCSNIAGATGNFQLRLGSEGTWSGSIAVHSNGTDMKNAIEDLDFDNGLKAIKTVHVTRVDSTSTSKEGYEWTVTFIGNTGNVPLLEYQQSIACTGGATVGIVEFIEGKANQFIIEPKKASGEPVKDLDAAAGFEGEDVFFSELWTSSPSITNGSHVWDSDGGVASYNKVRYDIQKLTTAGGSPFTGTFQITFDTTTRTSGTIETTGNLPHSISALELKQELEKLENVGFVDVIRSVQGNGSLADYF